MNEQETNNAGSTADGAKIAGRDVTTEDKAGTGYLALVLHGHLPFVRHPEHERFLEEDWLYEAITETYLPPIKIFDSLLDNDADFRITMSITPTLVSMLSDPLLQERYLRYLGRLIELSEKEVARTRSEPSFSALA